MAFDQPITTTYTADETVGVTLAKTMNMEFSTGPLTATFDFEVGVYTYFKMGVDLDMSNRLALYGVPGTRIYGTIAGGLGLSLQVIHLDVEVRAPDFTIVRASAPIVALLENFRFDREGFKSDFKIFSNFELRVAEIFIELIAKISVGIKVAGIDITQEILGIETVLWEFNGIDPLASEVHVGTGQDSDVTECQQNYYGWELFCIKKSLAINFAFSGLTSAECALLDEEYKRRSEVEGDTSYLNSTNEYRKVRGCLNDSYEFENVALEDWDLNEEQWDELSNSEFWKWDSRAVLSRKLEESGVSLDLTISQILSQAVFGEEPADVLNDAWKELTGTFN